MNLTGVHRKHLQKTAEQIHTPQTKIGFNVNVFTKHMKQDVYSLAVADTKSPDTTCLVHSSALLHTSTVRAWQGLIDKNCLDFPLPLKQFK